LEVHLCPNVQAKNLLSHLRTEALELHERSVLADLTDAQTSVDSNTITSAHSPAFTARYYIIFPHSFCNLVF
jgi:hypothetical protein